MLHLTYDYNFAMLADKTIDRPSSVSPSEWLEIWDRIAEVLNEKEDKRPDAGQPGHTGAK